ncbi:hypothetical protein EYF80_014443 [Liparis tanakae]|uniref:Uncharacterized protein n=1 Tax=Liparis tanakae TaxID=230148 RepID=A0A4Z2IBN0_9TELE|nr:hypothetical protein EYF80_014443 [Liparis tanakae]
MECKESIMTKKEVNITFLRSARSSPSFDTPMTPISLSNPQLQHHSSSNQHQIPVHSVPASVPVSARVLAASGEQASPSSADADAERRMPPAQSPAPLEGQSPPPPPRYHTLPLPALFQSVIGSVACLSAPPPPPSGLTSPQSCHLRSPAGCEPSPAHASLSPAWQRKGFSESRQSNQSLLKSVLE